MTVRLSRFIVDRYLTVLLEFKPSLEVVEQELMGQSGAATLGELLSHKQSAP